MLEKDELLRYNRQILIPEFGIEAQTKLKNAKILVVGAGGLGSPILLYLTAAGVGNIGIVENDTIDSSNLQRQILYSEQNIGNSKVVEAAKRLNELHSGTKVDIFQTFLSSQNALDIIKNYDLVIDGTDNFPTRYLINDACILLNKPFIYGAIYRFEGQIAVFNYRNSICYRDLFPNPPSAEQAPNCSVAGVLGVLPGIVGSIQALEAIKIITGIGESLSGKLYIIDTLSMQSRILPIPKFFDNSSIKTLIDYEKFCSAETNNADIRNISWEEVQELDNYLIVDVREKLEFLTQNIGGISIPLGELSKNINKIPSEQNIILVCQTGKRSQKAYQILESEGIFTQIFNLEGGIQSIC